MNISEELKKLQEQIEVNPKLKSIVEKIEQFANGPGAYTLAMCIANGPQPAQREQAFITRLCKKVGWFEVPEVRHIKGSNPFDIHSGPVEWLESESGIGLTPLWMEILGPKKTFAALAHELGHIIHGDSLELLNVRRRQEVQADAFAASLGYAEHLADALDDISFSDKHDWWDVHAPIKERIAYLRRQQFDLSR
jgi:Zn-dependent protease with chaperone function